MVLVAVVIMGALSGAAAYVLLNSNTQTGEPIRIGICADLDNTIGKAIWRAATLAAEQVNAEGGVLGRNFTIVAQDDDSETNADIAFASNAMTKLVTVDKADFVISNTGLPEIFFAEEGICAQNNKIMFTVSITLDEFTQRVIDDYDQYKYFFKLYGANNTAVAAGLLDGIVALGNYSGFTKVAFLYQVYGGDNPVVEALKTSLPTHGFEVVCDSRVSITAIDFTSNLETIEASGAEILVPIFVTRASVPFVREWCDRESPFIVVGILVAGGDPEFWNLSEGKCEYISTRGPMYLTNKSAAVRKDYLERWGTAIPTAFAIAPYDGIRYILPDAIKRAGNIETQAVIKALETTDVETSMARHFVFTSSHDIMIGAAGSATPPEEYMFYGIKQWQANMTYVPVVPEYLMKEAGATYKFPSWQGPWNK